MKKLTLITIATAFAASLNVSAAPTSFLETLDLNPSVDMNQRGSTDACADFTGNWKGTCAKGGTNKEESFELKQKGCEFIEVKSDHGKMILPIGGVISGGGSIPGAPSTTFGGSIESHWNKDHNLLTLHIAGGGKKLAIDESCNGLMMKEEVKLDGGKLLVNITGVKGETKFESKCEFTK